MVRLRTILLAALGLSALAPSLAQGPAPPQLWKRSGGALSPRRAGDSTQTGLLELTIAQPLRPGTYWLVAVPQGTPETGPTIRCSQGQTPYLGWSTGTTISEGANVAGYIRSSISGALPETTGLSGTTGAAPRVVVRVK